MEVIEKARELGLAIMEDERCKRLQTAKAANDSDMELQKIIGEFNLKRLQLDNEFNKPRNSRARKKWNRQKMNLRKYMPRPCLTSRWRNTPKRKKIWTSLSGISTALYR